VKVCMPDIILNHHRMYYREQGSGPLLIILPGNTSSSAWHERELAEFSRHYHTVALDLLGTGQSERVANWPVDWWQQAARDALALVEQLGEQQAVLVGTSGGAVAALWGAILGSGRVRAVIADSLTERLPHDALRAEVRARGEKTPAQVGFWRGAHGADWEQVVEADSRILLAFADQGGDWFGGRLKEISCPVLLTASLVDDLLPETGPQILNMAAQIPACEVFLVNAGGHPLMASRADAFHAAAEGFLRRAG
jgi:valacyclovir hydrolase